ncbi:MAG: hypothetical protein NWR72_07850, partial [Bacteroidia bacterium]|nr:hypothetical protein [Bacteroidia bacterium]
MRSLPSPWLIFFLQSFVACAIFWQTWLPQHSLVFTQDGDGLKNLFTLRAYLEHDTDAWYRFEAMNQPFGEYLWYTDATPLLALGMKALTQLGISASWLATKGFHLFLLLSIALSSVLLFWLLTKSKVAVWTAMVVSLAIPWVSPQLLRLFAGHFNLSFGWVILGLWMLLVKWEEVRGMARWAWALGLVIFLCLCASLHLYYLPMLAMMAGVWMLVSAWQQRQMPRLLAERMILAIAIPAMAGVILLSWISLTDPWLSIRPETAQGYNWSLWNLNPDSLWQAYAHMAFPAIPGLQGFLDIETHVYLGAFTIWTLVVGLVWGILSRTTKQVKRMLPVDRPSWRVPLLVSGLACLILALGEYVRFFGATVNFDNWIHPFKIMRLVSEDVTQFRCMGRFAFPAFWAAAIGATWLWDRMWKGVWGIGRWLMLLLLIPLMFDAGSQIMFLKGRLKADPLQSSQIANGLSESLISQAWAILPLPYYHVGSEINALTLDPVPAWEQRCLQASIVTGLPLLSSKMSRTPPAQAEALLSWIAGGNPPEGMVLDSILVMYSLR